MLRITAEPVIPTTVPSPASNAMTFDVEEWFHADNRDTGWALEVLEVLGFANKLARLLGRHRFIPLRNLLAHCEQRNATPQGVSALCNKERHAKLSALSC